MNRSSDEDMVSIIYSALYSYCEAGGLLPAHYRPKVALSSVRHAGSPTKRSHCRLKRTALECFGSDGACKRAHHALHMDEPTKYGNFEEEEEIRCLDDAVKALNSLLLFYRLTSTSHDHRNNHHHHIKHAMEEESIQKSLDMIRDHVIMFRKIEAETVYIYLSIIKYFGMHVEDLASVISIYLQNEMRQLEQEPNISSRLAVFVNIYRVFEKNNQLEVNLNNNNRHATSTNLRQIALHVILKCLESFPFSKRSLACFAVKICNLISRTVYSQAVVKKYGVEELCSKVIGLSGPDF